MNNETESPSITVTIGIKNWTFPVDEARSIYNELAKIFGITPMYHPGYE